MIFLDESGDPGFKFDQGSSAYFVIALVIFDDPLDAEETALKIKRLRERLKLDRQFEFKFSKSSDYFRYQFLETVRDSNFRVRAMVVDKRALHSEKLTTDKESFYGFFVSEVMKHNRGSITGASLKIDGSGDKAFKRSFQTYLRKKLREGTVSKFKFVDSKSDSLIQLSDMVAGAIYRSYNLDRRDSSFFDRIRHKVEDLWEFDKRSWPAS